MINAFTITESSVIFHFEKRTSSSFSSLHPTDAVQGFGYSQQAFCNAKVAVVYTAALLATTMKPFNVLPKFENKFSIKTVRFQVQLEADGYFSVQEVFAFAIVASRASWYQLAIFWIRFFKSDFKNTCWASPKPDIQQKNCADHVSSLMPNEQIFLEENLFYENRRWFIQYCTKPELLLPVLKVKSVSIPSGFSLGFS